MIASCAQPLGVLSPDPGRLDNRFHCFFAPDAEVDPSLVIEEGIELVWTDFGELREMILDGRFDSSLKIALLALATLKGCIRGQQI